MIGASSGQYGSFNLYSSTGVVQTVLDIGYTHNTIKTRGVSITPAIVTHGIYLDSGLPNREDVGLYSKKAIISEGRVHFQNLSKTVVDSDSGS